VKSLRWGYAPCAAVAVAGVPWFSIVAVQAVDLAGAGNNDGEDCLRARSTGA
jgi:hypothetical protein